MDIEYGNSLDPREDELIEAMNAVHDFPGFYPVVLIMRNVEGVRPFVDAAVAYVQDGDAYTVTEKASSKGTYLSFHLQLWVADARIALRRKEELRTLDGLMSIL